MPVCSVFRAEKSLRPLLRCSTESRTHLLGLLLVMLQRLLLLHLRRVRVEAARLLLGLVVLLLLLRLLRLLGRLLLLLRRSLRSRPAQRGRLRSSTAQCSCPWCCRCVAYAAPLPASVQASEAGLNWRAMQAA